MWPDHVPASSTGPDHQRICAFPATPVSFVKVITVWAPHPMKCTVEVMAACGDCTVERQAVCYPVGLCLMVDCDAPYYKAWWLPHREDGAGGQPR